MAKKPFNVPAAKPKGKNPSSPKGSAASSLFLNGFALFIAANAINPPAFRNNSSPTFKPKSP